MNGAGKISCCTTAYTYTYSKEGAAVVGAIGRLKKDGVIIKTYYSMGPWEKMSWQPEIELVKVKGSDQDSARILGVDPDVGASARK